jgi:hypothetical protein
MQRIWSARGDVEYDRRHEQREREDPDQAAEPVTRAAGDHASNRDDYEDDGEEGQDGGDDAHAYMKAPVAGRR